MPSDFPRSPRLIKGALVVFETQLPIPTNLIVFQYNPETMTRSVQPTGGSTPSGQQQQQQGSGDTQPTMPPIETFQLTVELDAADQLEAPGSNPLARAVGLHPTLAALELLVSPPSASLILNGILSLAGSSIISPARSPLVLFVWGPVRVVPVRVTSVSVTEQAFDQLLNPIQARVGLSMRALTIPELFQAGPPFNALGIVNLVAKEVLARSNVFNSAVQIGASVSF
jgi:hypothetical protein